MANNLESVGKIRSMQGTVRIEWDIKKFEELSEGKDEKFYFTSPSFEILAATWNILLYPAAWHPDAFGSRCVKIILQKRNSTFGDHHVCYSLKIKINEKVVHTFSEKECFRENTVHGKKNYLIPNSLANVQPEDTVTVLLYIFPADSNAIKKMTTYLDSTDATSEGKDILSTNMEDLYLKQQDCDLKIRVKTKEFKVHKAILSARSPVLYSMLHHDMAEKNTGIVDIVDSEPEIFENFLLYLYTGRVDNLSWNNVTQLFTAGDKYDLEHLKKECRKYMLNEICVDRLCDVIVLAMKHDEIALLRCAEDFFVENVKSVLFSKKWQEFHNENPTVCNELFIKFVSSLPSEKK